MQREATRKVRLEAEDDIGDAEEVPEDGAAATGRRNVDRVVEQQERSNVKKNGKTTKKPKRNDDSPSSDDDASSQVVVVLWSWQYGIVVVMLCGSKHTLPYLEIKEKKKDKTYKNTN